MLLEGLNKGLPQLGVGKSSKHRRALATLREATPAPRGEQEEVEAKEEAREEVREEVEEEVEEKDKKEVSIPKSQTKEEAR